jgi:hypothetical protein
MLHKKVPLSDEPLHRRQQESGLDNLKEATSLKEA